MFKSVSLVVQIQNLQTEDRYRRRQNEDYRKIESGRDGAAHAGRRIDPLFSVLALKRIVPLRIMLLDEGTKIAVNANNMLMPIQGGPQN